MGPELVAERFHFTNQCNPGIYSRDCGFPLEAINMPSAEWVKNLDDGRKVKFTYQELPDDGAFMTAQLAGNQVVYSVLLAAAKNPLSRKDVERHFEAELAKK
jgi:hypothetical protein